MTTSQESAEKLRAEILSDAQKKADEIVGRATEDAERFLSAAALEADQVRQEVLDHGRREADRRRELVLAAIPVETGRLRAARLEALLESVYQDVRQSLLNHKGFSYREALISLAAHAICRMAGETFVVRVSEGDRTMLGNGLSEEIERRVGRSVIINISYEQSAPGAGVVVEDGEGRQVWDNRFIKRLDRLWPELRRRIAIQTSLVTKTGIAGDEQ